MMMIINKINIYKVNFWTGTPVQYRNEKMPTSQLVLLLHEILDLREPLVGSLAFFHFGTEQGNPN